MTWVLLAPAPQQQGQGRALRWRLSCCTPPPAGERLWVRTGTETLQLWEWRLATQEGAAGGDVALADFAECRAAAAAAAASCPAVAAAAPFAEGIDYLATCHWDAASQQLLLAAGSNTGAVGFFPVREERPGAGPNSDGVIPMQAGVVQAPLVVLAGTHSDVVRSVSTFDGPAAAAGLLCVTGGEDARVCLWSTSQVGGGGGAASAARPAGEGPGPARHAHRKQQSKRRTPY